MNGFKNCYYDPRTNKIWLKEQGIKGWQHFEYKPWCYISDPEEKSPIKDIYKRPLKKFNFKKKDELAGLKGSGIIVAESDLRPEVKFMHERYDHEEINVNIDDWNICLFDIEVAGSSKFYNEQIIEIRNLEKNIFKKVELADFDRKYVKEEYEVFDIEKNCWIKYTDSCFVSYEFPAPEKANWPINLITCYSSRTGTTYTWGLEPYVPMPKDSKDNTIDEVKNYTYCRNEKELMEQWTSWFKRQDFDIISGWNSVSYDIPYIINRCAKLRKIWNLEPIPKNEWERKLSPFGKMPEAKQLSDRKLEGVDLGTSFEIPGLYSIDYMEMYKTFGNHPPMPSYSLNYVSSIELKDSKLKYEGNINEAYKIDFSQFARYNVKDVTLIVRMEAKNKLFPLLIEYAYDCIVTLDKVSNKVPTTTGYILKFLHSTNRVLNDKKESHEDWWTKENCYKIPQKDGSIYYQNTEWEDDNPEFKKYLIKDKYFTTRDFNSVKDDVLNLWKSKKIEGIKKTPIEVFKLEMNTFAEWPHPFEEFHVKAGYCYDYPGRFDDDMSFDITSSYPHHIMQFNISPETVVRHPTFEQIASGEVILSDVAEVGFLRTDDAILPNIVKQVFAERKIWKKKEEEAIAAGDTDAAGLYHNRQMTKKLIINSVYGVSLAGSFHLYNPDCARAICRCARVTLRDWLSKSCNEYYTSKYCIKDIEKYFNIELKNKEPLKITNRESAIIHNDTDSAYICIHEMRQRLIEEGIYTNRKTKEYIPSRDNMSPKEQQELMLKNSEIFRYNEEVEAEYRDFFEKAENLFQDFFNKVLEIRAAKSKTENKIKYNRENIFTNMFCFAKKLYIGNIVDSEGEQYPFEAVRDIEFTDDIMKGVNTKYEKDDNSEEANRFRKFSKHQDGKKHKIMGVPIKKSTMPDFCKVAAEKLAFDICAGADKQTCDDFIMKTYDQYCSSDINEISAVIGISDYKKYVPNDIDYYIQHGLEFDKGDNASVIFGAKAALTYNYVVAKKRLKLTPINNNTKMKYIYVKPNNEFRYKEVGKPGYKPVNFISFLDQWPKEFDDLFEIDYETMFRKSFCALFESMYEIQNWIKPGQKLKIEQSDLESIFF